MYVQISDPGMGPKVPQARRDLEIVQRRDNSHREWDLKFLRCSGTSRLSRGGTTPTARWLRMSPLRSASSRSGRHFHTMRGGVDQGSHHCRPRDVGVVGV